MKSRELRYEEAVSRNFGSAKLHVKRGGHLGYSTLPLPSYVDLKIRFGIRKTDTRFDDDLVEMHTAIQNRLKAKMDKAVANDRSRAEPSAGRPVGKVREKKDRKRAG